jgi:hypothetical protein
MIGSPNKSIYGMGYCQPVISVNGENLIKAFPDWITLPTGQLKLENNQIAIDGSNYTSSKKLREIFRIK